MAKGNAIRLFLTMQKLMYREALLYQFMLLDKVSLVGESSTGVHTLESIEESGANVLIIEEDLPDNDGLTISEIALEQDPSLIIVLLVDKEISRNRLAIYLESGIKSVISSQQPISELVKVLNYIMGGQIYIGSEYYPTTAPHKDVEIDVFQSLSQREQEVALFIAKRMEIKLIAETMGVSNKTVHSYKDRILTKMGFERLPELVLFMQRYKSHAQP